MSSDFVQTVLGPVPASELGHTQMHEHLLSDQRVLAARATPSSETGPWIKREVSQDSIRPWDYQWIRRFQGHHAFNLVLDDIDCAVEELADYSALGGRTLVEVTSLGLGRDPDGLAQIARRSGVNIVMGCGYYTNEFHPSHVETLSVDDIAREIVSDIQVGVGSSGIRAGIIGEIGLSWPAAPGELRSLRGAALAQAETGLVMQVHPGRHSDAPNEALEVIAAEGGNVARTIIAHIDRTFASVDQMLNLARTGCYLEFDLFGYESSHYPYAPIDLPNDATRIDFLRRLSDAGHLDQLLISTDIAQKVRLRTFGGEGYGYILESVLPVMARKGFSEDEVRAITQLNPARALAPIES
jgi:phosphotriesterase-related protein